MDRDPGDFPARTPTKPFSDMSEKEQDAWLESLPPPPGIPQTDQEVEASIARAQEDFAAGRFYSHAVVSRWLMTWGKPGRKPFKIWLAEQDG